MNNVAQAAVAPPQSVEQAETTRAMVNAATLALSLGGSWSIAIALRLALPRMLGPLRFGELHFSDSFAATFMVFSSLGLDTYVRKHVSVDARTATHFLGGALVLRALAAGVLMALMMVAFSWSGGTAAPTSLVLLCGVAQATLAMNTLLAALMDARGLTRKAAPLAVVSKAIYAVGVVTVLFLGAPLQAVPVCMLVAELWRGTVLWRRVSHEFPGRWPVDLKASALVVLTATPFYLNQVMHSVYGELDVSIIAFGQGALEAGYFGAGNNLTALTLIMMPLLPAVLMPAGARAASRSAAELERLMGSAWRVVLLGSIPLATLLTVGAPEVVQLVFGASYAPSVMSLRILAPTVVISYASTLAAIYLIQQDRTWFVTVTSVVGLVANILFNLLAIPLFYERLGAGGAGAGAAAASLSTELVVLGLMAARGVRPPPSAKAWQSLRAAAIAVAASCAAYHLLPLDGAFALLGIAVAYAVAGYFSGAVPLAPLVQLLRWLRARSVTP